MISDPAGIHLLDWALIDEQLDTEGYALLPGLLQPQETDDLLALIPEMTATPLAASNLGHGELFYFDAVFPAALKAARAALYCHLVSAANRWNTALGTGCRYPEDLDSFVARCHQAGQTQTVSHLSRLRRAGHVVLHQRADGEQIFPFQLVALLAEPGKDFTGGEFVMTEQRPRMQSRPIVVPLRRGDAAIISTAQRPVKGAKAWYRVNLKHAIGTVRGGERIGLTLSFHDAPV
ncbi:prolyl 4-hydroxylase [Allopusillimonas soli]|uniref:2OG-Fe(II) oxygenase n=1 Tax=Allopusillimonas soli TaxID=659016 RepID=A0A853F9W8_9BURK|nr:2OG-Fe(II) oxygenase [Allopusillimonas soli]NYT36578.1 2OG-Fe(II) oxygenase [Allopusillimonas soli]TEA75071.1 prolyl 4-hydroxylase [Allopusillimonas soli]